MTPFQEVYDYFLHSITDDLYITLDEEETKEDLFLFLKKATVKFRYPKKDLSYNKESDSFNESLDSIECYILSLYMLLEWLDRQMATVRLTELQYTGSDLKSIGTKSQMSTLIEAYSHFNKELEKELKYYHYKDEKSYNLAGKKYESI